MKTVAYDHQIFSLQRFGGISRYFSEVAARVQQQPGWRACVVAPVHFNEHLADSGAPGWRRHLPMRVPRTGRLYRATNALLGPLLLSSVKADILHRTWYSAALSPGRGRLVVTVHDMIHELFPQYLPAGDPTAEHKRRNVEAADHVICVSHNTARDVMRLLGVSPEKISVTHLGFSDSFGKAATPGGARPGIRPYLLHVGHRGAYKNFGRVLEAYASSTVLKRDFDFVAFGGMPFDATEWARFAALGLRENSVRREDGSEADLARAYAGAHAFVYPSEYEGFGIPPLEAMSSGCPVACSQTSSLPEVVGDAAVLFDPLNTDSIRQALESICVDQDLRVRLASAAAVRVRLFSWNRCAVETLAAYERALGA